MTQCNSGETALTWGAESPVTVRRLEPEGVERRLGAILNADVVGYTRLVAQDEVATLRTLKSYVGLMGGLGRQHGGRVVDAEALGNRGLTTSTH